MRSDAGDGSDGSDGAYIGISGDEASGYVLTHLRYPASDDRSMGVRIQGERAEVSVPAGCGGCVAELAVSYGGEVATATAASVAPEDVGAFAFSVLAKRIVAEQPDLRRS